MPHSIKRDVSLTVLKVRLLDNDAASAPSARPDADNQALSARQRIFCELQVTGDAGARGMAAPTAEGSLPGGTRRQGSPRRRGFETDDSSVQSAPLSRTVAQWSYEPAEMKVPVHYAETKQFSDRPGLVAGWLAQGARALVSMVLSDMRADSLERFAASSSWLPSGRAVLPAPMARQLRATLPSVMREGDCLWLEIAQPTGYLPLLPWEEMLRPVTDAPILRLSPHPLKASSSDRELSVALCITVPSATWVPQESEIAGLLAALRDALPAGSTVHVFADDLCESIVRSAIARGASTSASTTRIRRHPLPAAQDLASAAGNAWRDWVVQSLGRQAVDILHCYACGLLFADQARLVLTREPVAGEDAAGARPRLLRHASASDIAEALVALGAWAVVLSVPVRGPWASQSRLGLRLFADEIARLRAGAAALHDGEFDPDFAALRDTYRFIIGDPSVKASTSGAVAVYCHPARATPMAAALSSLPRELVAQYMGIAETIDRLYGKAPLPLWVAAALRVAEQAVSRVASNTAPGGDDAVTRGIAAALGQVQAMIARGARHVQAASDVQQPLPAPTEGKSNG